MLDLDDMEILDDSEKSMTAEAAKKAVEDGKRRRREAREENQRILRQDAKNAADLRAQQLSLGSNILRVLAGMEALFGRLVNLFIDPCTATTKSPSSYIQIEK